MDLSKILNSLYRYLWLLVLTAIVASLTTFLVINNEPVSYRATTQLLVGPSLDSPSPDLNALRIGGQLIYTYAELAATRSFLEAVNKKLSNERFVQNAKPEIVENERRKQNDAEQKIKVIEESLAALD